MVYLSYLFLVCPTPGITVLENGRFRITRNVRAGLFLLTDVIEYTCDDNYRFHVGKQSDYSFECSQDGNWLNSESGNDLQAVELLCITGLNVFIRHSNASHNTF